MEHQSMKHPASHTLICIGIALSVGALAACSDSSTPSTQVASPPAAATGGIVAKQSDQAASDAAIFASGIVTKRKACDLMIRPDAEVAVGQPLPQNTVNLALGMCDFNAADFSAGASVTVGSWESVKAAATSGKTVPASIGGVGDEALNLNGSNGSLLYVRKGNEGFLLEVHGPKIDPLPDRGLAAEKDLAAKILARF
jgi:hypothetical protein